jgi:hypothetical protein
MTQQYIPPVPASPLSQIPSDEDNDDDDNDGVPAPPRSPPNADGLIPISPMSLQYAELDANQSNAEGPNQIRSAELIRVRSGASSASVTSINRRSYGTSNAFGVNEYGPVRSVSPRNSSLRSIGTGTVSNVRRQIEASSSRSLSALADYHGISLPPSHSVPSSPAAAARTRSAVESSLSRSHTPSQWTQPRSVHSSSHSTSSM